jgi:hypothetical protein
MVRSSALLQSVLRSVLVAGVMLGVAAQPSLAAGPYTWPDRGYDVSYPQCGATAPTGRFAILGVTHGRAFSTNSCLTAEYGQAIGQGIAPDRITFYMNLNAAIGSTASKGATGPAGPCKASDKACQAYNYGYNAAAEAYGYAATSVGQSGSVWQSGVWWLDIETANSWQVQGTINRQTILGAARLLGERGQRVGIYSTQSMWNKITGTWSTPDLPIWYAGTSSCDYANSHKFTGGEVWLVQAGSATNGGDIAC